MTPETSFQPDADFAVAAQQDEINRLRGENSSLSDRNVYLSACMRQLRSEAAQQVASLTEEVSMLKSQVETLNAKLTEADPNHDENEVLGLAQADPSGDLTDIQV